MCVYKIAIVKKMNTYKAGYSYTSRRALIPKFADKFDQINTPYDLKTSTLVYFTLGGREKPIKPIADINTTQQPIIMAGTIGNKLREEKKQYGGRWAVFLLIFPLHRSS